MSRQNGRGEDGLVAIVTGAASGIGAATARQLRSEGARVFGLDLVRGDSEDGVEWVFCDVGSAESVRSAFRVVSEHSEALDILVNNAGVGAVGTVETATEEEWAKVFNINVYGIARVTAAALPLLRKSQAASVVNTCSVASTVGLTDRAIYTASKGAVEALTRAMAADHLRDNIRVNCVSPGTADTPWVTRLLDEASDPQSARAALEGRQPNGRLVSAQEIASAICFLAHPRQSAITGTTLAVDGGMHSIRVSSVVS